MSLTAAGRFGGSSAPQGRRGAVLGASAGLHLVLLMAVAALGHRMVSWEGAPAEVELMFEAPAPVPEVKLEAAVPAPVAVTEAVPSEVVGSSAPVAADAAPVPPAEVSLPAMAEARPAPKVEPPRRMAMAREVARPAVVRPSAAASVAAPTPVAPAAPVVRKASVSAVWQGELAGWIRARTRYPEEAKARGEQGAVVVSFTVGRDGQVLEATLRQRSGSDRLDQAALAMFRAARVPAFPADMDAPEVTISVPVRYRLEP